MPKMTGNQYFAKVLESYGVSHIFYVNTVLTDGMNEIAKTGKVVRVITHGEKSAAYMADGYARASHKPGICLCQDIGTTNLAAGLRDASMAGSAVIAITGGQNDEPRYRNAYQNTEDNTAWDGVTKANFVVSQASRFPDLLRQAFRVATSGAPGPVHLELRGNVGQSMDEEGDYEILAEKRFLQFPAFRPVPEPETIEAGVATLRDAKKPIIVAGSGVATSGAEAELVKLAELLDIPVATSLRAKAIISDDHPLAVGVPGAYSRQCANQAIAAADLVFFVGSHTGGQVTNGWQTPKMGTPVVQLDIAPEELGRNYPNVVSLQGDAKATLQKMIDAVGNKAVQRTQWMKQVRGYVDAYRAKTEPLRNSDALPIRPERLCRELEDWLPASAVLVVDTFHAAIWTAQMTRLTKPGQRYLACAGSLGWAFPAAMGVKAALPDKPVIGFCGDAGFYYHLAELETAARLKLNIVMVVNNNLSGGVSEVVRFDSAVNFAKVAESMGCFGIRVEKPEDIRPALEKALAAGRPAVVEVMSDVNIRAERGWVPSAVSGE